jgi:tetratricopeptide (TPR) repeat protein
LSDELVASTPAYELSRYRLVAWKESNSVALAEKAYFWDGSSKPFSLPGVGRISAVFFEAERLVRFPSSPNWEQAAWATAYRDPLFVTLPGMRPGQDLFMFQTEKLFNQGGLKFEELKVVLQEHGFVLGETFQMDDLFGDGQSSIIFEVKDSRWGAIFVLRLKDGHYRIEKLLEWNVVEMMFYGESISFLDVGDTNANGLSELGVEYGTFFGGMRAPQMSSTLKLYEWDPIQNEFNFYNFAIFNQFCDQGPCVGKWEFGSPNASGIRPLTVTDYQYIRQYMDLGEMNTDRMVCPYLERHRTYLWYGETYTLISEKLIPPPEEPAKCRVDWALEAGHTNNLAMEILSAALSDWPEDIDQDWGPATRDFVRLQTGLWYELRGEGKTAVEILQPLAGNPIDPNYPLFAQLAKKYLNNRAKVGVLGAFLKLDEEWRNSIKELPERMIYVDLAPVREQWGYAHDNWRQWIRDLFPMTDAIKTGLLSKEISTTQQLKSWLGQSGFSYLDLQSADFNGDGLEDSLVMQMDQDWPDEVRLHLFINSPFGMTYDYFGLFSDRDDPKTLTMRTFRPGKNAPLITIALVNDYLETFLVNDKYKSEDLIFEYNVSSFETNDTLVVHTLEQDGRQVTITYAWDPQSSSLEKVPDYDFAAALQEAKRWLFYEQDYPATIEFIERFLVESPPEQKVSHSCKLGVCEYWPLWYRPAMQYLLALAYELNGQPQKALETYYRLWQEEPDSIFGMAASLKLEVSR